jgi:hypothetical protein
MPRPISWKTWTYPIASTLDRRGKRDYREPEGQKVQIRAAIQAGAHLHTFDDHYDSGKPYTLSFSLMACDSLARQTQHLRLWILVVRPSFGSVHGIG